MSDVSNPLWFQLEDTVLLIRTFISLTLNFMQYKRPSKLESPAFPNIIEMKLKLYKLMNISMSPKIMQKHIMLYVFLLDHQENTHFCFDVYPPGK